MPIKRSPRPAQRSAPAAQPVLPSFPGGALPAPEQPLQTFLIRAVAVLALTVSLVYLVWRTAYTVDLAVWWVSVPLLLCEAHAALGLALFTFSLWKVDTLPRRRIVEHTDVRIATLIPTFNEGPEILLPTIAAAVALKLPHETWVLDDGDRPWVAQLAAELGARYLARPEHQHAKAGNINYALGIIQADFIVVLDADHVAAPELLTHTLGYFDDPKVALVQTPQDFYNLSSFEHSARRVDPSDRNATALFHEQALFYRLLQPGKNQWGAAFWCGTNAVVRVAALRDVGGIATETITEDIHTTIRLHRRGWKTLYHNEVLARGLAATTAEQFRLQRYRWGRGAMQVLKLENPLVVPGLRLRQRLAYAATLLGWFDAWRSLAYLLIPIVVLLSGVVPIRAQPLTFAAFFGLTFALQQAAMQLLSRGFYRPITAAMFDLVRMTPNMLATLTLLRPGSNTFRVTPKGREGHVRRKAPMPHLLAAVAALSLVAGLWFTLTALGLTPLHYGVPWAAYGAAFWLIVNFGLVLFGIRRVRSVKFGSERRRSVRFATALAGSLHRQTGRISDVSLTGARIETGRSVVLPVGAETVLTLLLDDSPLALLVVVRKRDALPGNRLVYGVEFTPGQASQQARLARALFNGQGAVELDVAPAAPSRSAPELAFS